MNRGSLIIKILYHEYVYDNTFKNNIILASNTCTHGDTVKKIKEKGRQD